jgi:hypothetical protein
MSGRRPISSYSVEVSAHQEPADLGPEAGFFACKTRMLPISKPTAGPGDGPAWVGSFAAEYRWQLRISINDHERGTCGLVPSGGTELAAWSCKISLI